MDVADVTLEALLKARLITKAALRPRASKPDEMRRLDALEHAKFRYAKNVADNAKLKQMMQVDQEYASWFEVFNGVPISQDDQAGCDSFVYTNSIILAVSAWKERAYMAAHKKGRLALALMDCKVGRERRILRVRLQTPDWVDFEKIREVYIERDLITAKTGILHHVDHIVPLAGRKAVGFHVHDNLQIITAEENIKKWNKFEPWA